MCASQRGDPWSNVPPVRHVAAGEPPLPRCHRVACMTSNRLYCDHNASTPLDASVRRAIVDALDAGVGNPSSRHWAGALSRELVDRARLQVAAAFAVEPDRVVFTSGGTESDNHALHAGLALREARRELAISAIEHPAVADTARALVAEGRAKLVELPVNASGVLRQNQLDSRLGAATALASVMLANNETGAEQPVAIVAEHAHAVGALCHCDAAQAVGKVPVKLRELQVDLLSVAGHKFGAPKGIGALILAPGIEPPPLLHGGGHEGGRRPGTESTVLIAALGAACAAIPERLERMAGLERVRDRFELELTDMLGEAVAINAADAPRLPNTSSVAFLGRRGAAVLAALPEVAASTGSACHEGRETFSPVLAAMGIAARQARGTVRFSFGPEHDFTTMETLLRLIQERLPTVPVIDDEAGL